MEILANISTFNSLQSLWNMSDETHNEINTQAPQGPQPYSTQGNKSYGWVDQVYSKWSEQQQEQYINYILNKSAGTVQRKVYNNIVHDFFQRGGLAAVVSKYGQQVAALLNQQSGGIQ